MKFLDLINKCLVELNYKSVSTFEELKTGDHKRLMGIINRLNNELVLSNDWDFRIQAFTMMVGASNTYEVMIPFDGKILELYVDKERFDFEPDYRKFLDGVSSPNTYSIFAGKLLVGPFDETSSLNFKYYSNSPAQSGAEVLKSQMALEDDSSVMPDLFAENVLVYGACMRFKAMPSHPKYKHWSGEYVRGLRLLHSSAIQDSSQNPQVVIKRN